MWRHYAHSHTGFCVEFDTSVEVKTLWFLLSLSSSLVGGNLCSKCFHACNLLRICKTIVDKQGYILGEF
jgi:hypothetical protein